MTVFGATESTHWRGLGAGNPIVKILVVVKAGAVGPVAGADRIDDIVWASGLCKEMKIGPRVVGVDVANRGGRAFLCWRWLCWPMKLFHSERI